MASSSPLLSGTILAFFLPFLALGEGSDGFNSSGTVSFSAPSPPVISGMALAFLPLLIFGDGPGTFESSV